MYMIGGRVFSNDCYRSVLWSYSLACGKWEATNVTTASPIPPGRYLGALQAVGPEASGINDTSALLLVRFSLSLV